MRKITTLIFVSVMVCMSAFAAGDWASSAVSIAKDNGTAYLYLLNNAGWVVSGTYGSNTAFAGNNFGTPVSLVLNGGETGAWADGGDFYDATSFVLYYRVYLSSGTGGTWSQLNLDNMVIHTGNNYQFDKTTGAVNLLALATLPGTNTYTLEVVIAKNQFYTGGNWNSMVPGGQNTAYNNATAGYKATFTSTVSTGLDQLESGLKIATQQGKIDVHFDGSAKVELFSITGQQIHSAMETNQYTETVKNGCYLLRLNGETHKILVQ